MVGEVTFQPPKTISDFLNQTNLVCLFLIASLEVEVAKDD